MREARAAVLRWRHPAMNTYSNSTSRCWGNFRGSICPRLPPEMILFPRWLFFNIHELSSWTRAMLMPLAILNHFRPRAPVPAELSLHELYPAGTEHSDLRPRWRQPRLSWPNFSWRAIGCSSSCATWVGGLSPGGPAPVRGVDAGRIGDGSDGLGAIFPAMLNSLIALQALVTTSRIRSSRKPGAISRAVCG